jgi:hypothetical protein
MQGKAVWFAVPAPMAHPKLADVTGLRSYTQSVDVTADREHGRISPRHAAGELTRMLAERGFGRSVFSRSDDADDNVSVLALRRGLTLWCRPGTVTLTAPASKPQRWAYTDLVDAAEETICRFEVLATERPRELVTA